MKKGFTLIELLVVIAIIGVLFSLVIISIKGAREKSMEQKNQICRMEYQKVGVCQ